MKYVNGMCLSMLVLVFAFTPCLGQDLWQTPTDGDIWAMARTGDLDGDGRDDLLAGCADNQFRALSSADGTVLWSVPTQGDVWCVASFPDLDGDGRLDAVAGTSNNEVLVVSGTGAVLWRHSTGGDVWSIEQAGDISDDGFPELACGAGDNRVYLLNLKTEQQIWSVNLRGDVWDLVAGEDLNDDGIGDIVAGTAFDQVVALNGLNGDSLWEFGTNGDVWVLDYIEDLDGDGIAEIAAGTALNRVVCIPGSGPTGGGGGGGSSRIWQAQAGSDIHVLQTVGDYNADGTSDLIIGGLDNYFRFLDGKTGEAFWSIEADGAIKDAIAAADLDDDGLADFIYCTDGATVNAVSAADGELIWTYYSPDDNATFWSLAPLPDINGDDLPDLAAGSALNIVFGLPSYMTRPPESITDLACMPVDSDGAPAVMLTWAPADDADSLRISALEGDTETPVAELPGTATAHAAAATGAADLQTFLVTPINSGGEGPSESCTATMNPPPISDLACGMLADGSALASWTLPAPGDRELDGIRVLVDGVEKAVLPPTAAEYSLGELPAGSYDIIVRTIWGSWDSPDYSCSLQLVENISNFICVPAQTETGPGVHMTWTATSDLEEIFIDRVLPDETLERVATLPATATEFLCPVTGDEVQVDFRITGGAGGNITDPLPCRVIMTPPPVMDVLCGAAGGESGGFASWTLPDPGLVALDGIKVVLNGETLEPLPPTATGQTFGELAVGTHTVVVTTIWGPWESPVYTCEFEIHPAVTNLTCVAAQTDSGPGVRLTWIAPPLPDAMVRITSVIGQETTVLGEVQAGEETFLAPVISTLGTQAFEVTTILDGQDGQATGCVATMTPPPVDLLSCLLQGDQSVAVEWVLPDAGERVLSGVRLLVDNENIDVYPTDTTTTTLPPLTEGVHYITCRTVWEHWESPNFTYTLTVNPSEGVAFVRGDANLDGSLDLADVIFVLGYLFQSKPSTCKASMEVNSDGRVDLGDPIFILAYLFRSASAPGAPFPDCGVVEGADCESFPRCNP